MHAHLSPTVLLFFPCAAAGGLPCLRSARISSSQALLAEVLAAAAPQLSSVQLTVRSATPDTLNRLQVCFDKRRSV